MTSSSAPVIDRLATDIGGHHITGRRATVPASGGIVLFGAIWEEWFEGGALGRAGPRPAPTGGWRAAGRAQGVAFFEIRRPGEAHFGFGS